MKELFIHLLNMSIVAGWLILALILFRLIFKKAPKWIVGILYTCIAFRLICPFSLECSFSLIPSTDTFAIRGNIMSVSSGIEEMDSTLNAYLNGAFIEEEKEAVSNSEKILNSKAATIFLYVWIAGILILVLGSLFSYYRLKIKLRDAVMYEPGIYQTEKCLIPFVFGIIHPIIIIPFRLKDESLECVIMHEKAHIKRKDYLIKPLGYILFAIYWFNPLIWIAYNMLCRDIELSCDERVIRELGFDKKKVYSRTLLECSLPTNVLLSCPVAFAEIGVKERIKNVMELKKTKITVIIVAFLAVMVLILALVTNPSVANEKEDVTNNDTSSDLSIDVETDLEDSSIDVETDVEVETDVKDETDVEVETDADAEIGLISPSLICPISTEYTLTLRFSDEHQAMDMAAPMGTPLLAAFDGEVSATGFDTNNGNYIVITNDEGWSIYYNNCENVTVNSNDKVKTGDEIGTLGSTGRSTGPHLHFAVSNPDGSFLDPEKLINK